MSDYIANDINGSGDHIDQLSFQFQIVAKNEGLISRVKNLSFSCFSVDGIIIIGNRKSGKTTLLKQIATPNWQDHWLDCSVGGDFNSLEKNIKNKIDWAGELMDNHKTAGQNLFIDDINLLASRKEAPRRVLFLFKELLDALKEANVCPVATSDRAIKDGPLPDLTSRLSNFHQEFVI